MKPVSTVGSRNYEVWPCSLELNRLINKADKFNPNPLPQRESMLDLPLNKLNVGYSYWLNLDNLPKPAVEASMRSMRLYNKRFNDLFAWKKHRGDDRLSGFKYLEIGRIK